MTQHQFNIFDGDGHVLESDAQLDKYYEGKFKGAALASSTGSGRLGRVVRRRVRQAGLSAATPVHSGQPQPGTGSPWVSGGGSPGR